ncbi:MAG: hypothetical protein J1E16_05570 [Muribaculaceae bacterium]|nr:hypothetical protein [Muribaculaceae bacterium]
MTTVNIVRTDDMSVAVLEDKEALKELVEFLKEDIEKFLWDSINGYNHQLKREDSILRPKGEKVAFKCTIEFGDADEISFEEDEDDPEEESFELPI